MIVVFGGLASITVVGSLAESLAVFVSPPPETVAVFVTSCASRDTLTLTVIAEAVTPPASGEPIVQSTVLGVLLLQLQTAPMMTD